MLDPTMCRESRNYYKPGCDVERCPKCGFQALQCFSDETGKLICVNTKKRVYNIKKRVYKNLLKWTGEWPGKADCRRLNLWCIWDDNYGWVSCSKDTPGAREDLNALYTDCKWDAKKKRFVKRKKPLKVVPGGDLHCGHKRSKM